MTEATGGITMTPPNEYTINSVGKALPGIDLKLAEDGELCMEDLIYLKVFLILKNLNHLRMDGFTVEIFLKKKMAIISFLTGKRIYIKTAEAKQ